MTYTSLICFFLISYLVQAKGRNDSTCPKSFSCGNLTDLSFPFSLSTQSDCGVMFLSGCDAKPYPRIQLLPGGDSYYALGNPFNYTVFLGDPKLHAKLRQHKCQAFNKNFSLPNSSSISFEILPVNILNFIKCNSTNSSTPNITQKMKDHFAGYRMYNGCKGFSIYYKLPGGDGEDVRAGNLPANCSLIRLPVLLLSDDGGLFNMLSAAFAVEWKLSADCYKCHYGGGQCQTDITNKFHCSYPNNPHDHQKNDLNAQDAKMTRSKLGPTLGAGAVLFTVGLLVFLWDFVLRVTKELLFMNSCQMDLLKNLSMRKDLTVFVNWESIVSMLGARGTIGYIAPEIVCRNLGGVSHKSDVYSYGMMVLEMVGGRKNVDVGVDRTSEIYFPHWLYQRIELDEELQLIGIMNEEEKECARKMVMVSLWCIQTDPSNRPSMSKVVEMLEGKLDSLQMPPKPYLYSPTRTEVDSSVLELA
ncbi:uncharacterized protein [Solanum tuberosum]|uniref:uncharacterized protein n=1 Tax=Solanum tuberosum TaxID=4113 RepID=UPI00073A07ED|nr:PREDICTED: uncharacterized protein LOC107060000 [Solanum tuberosum]